jgi:hypothetical protein
MSAALQMVLTAMVKTLGSATQSFAMRSACALCISYCAHALAEQPRHEQQQPADSTAADAAAPSSPQQQQATTPRTGSKCSAAAGGSPSPSSSPRSAPVEVSFEELCAEPGLLGNLLACMSPEKVLIAAKEAAPRGKPQPTHLQAAELARSAVRAVAAMLRVRGSMCNAPELTLDTVEYIRHCADNGYMVCSVAQMSEQ